METMTPMDFLDFRDLLRPASGFQSWQFKLLEARLGLKYEHRFGQQYYISQLRQPEIDIIRSAEKEPSLLQLLNTWLERMPAVWTPDQRPQPSEGEGQSLGFDEASSQSFWSGYRLRYQQSLAEPEKANLERFDSVFGIPAGATTAVPPMAPASPQDAAPASATEPGSNNASSANNFSGGCPAFATSPAPANDPSVSPTPPPARSLSPAACRSALFIMLYRGYPLLQLPFQVLHQLLEIDEQLSTWRYRHMSMVHRMIGTRIGTGGSTGKDYLGSALERHHLFKEIAGLTSFLIERRRLPALSPEIERRLGFVSA